MAWQFQNLFGSKEAKAMAPMPAMSIAARSAMIGGHDGQVAWASPREGKPVTVSIVMGCDNPDTPGAVGGTRRVLRCPYGMKEAIVAGDPSLATWDWVDFGPGGDMFALGPVVRPAL